MEYLHNNNLHQLIDLLIRAVIPNNILPLKDQVVVQELAEVLLLNHQQADHHQQQQNQQHQDHQ